MKKVAVLLSTYCGERFLCDQLDTILSQEGVEVSLFVRDDGSKDGTLQILEKYEALMGVTVFHGENCGVGNSFMELVYKVPKTFDCYAFADQDDLWEPNKLSAAVSLLEGQEGPCLYASNQLVTDAEGKATGLRYPEPPPHSYLQVISRNYLAGCTMVWDKALQALLSDPRRRPAPSFLRNRIHDVWVAAVAAVCGTILYDQNAYIRYRQHESNVVGAKQESFTERLGQLRKKLRDPNQRNGRSLTAQELCLHFPEYLKEKEPMLRAAAEYRESWGSRTALMRKAGEWTPYSGEGGSALRMKMFLGLF